jgi:hypothetical protein
MTPILALDLGNYKTVACSYDPANTYTGMTNASGWSRSGSLSQLRSACGSRYGESLTP